MKLIIDLLNRGCEIVGENREVLNYHWLEKKIGDKRKGKTKKRLIVIRERREERGEGWTSLNIESLHKKTKTQKNKNTKKRKTKSKGY